MGRRLAAGETLDDIRAAMNQVAEGVNTARTIHGYAVKHGISMPICRAVYEMAFEQKTPHEVLADLMTNQATYEIDRPILS